MANIQLYTGEQAEYYSDEQLSELKKALDPRLVSTRKGGGNRTLAYIEGHDAIDNANRIFGYGNWCYEPVSLEQVVLIDPIDGEAVGIEYKALVKLSVRGAIGPVIDVGSQPVATWSVEDQVMGRRVNDAKYNHTEVNEAPFTLLEKRNARAVIVESHEQAKKGAVTDALKRCLRSYGNQFGNGLYGDGPVDLDEPVNGNRVIEERPRQIAAVKQPSRPAPATEPIDEAPATDQQLADMSKLYEVLGRQMPKRSLTYAQAKTALRKLTQAAVEQNDGYVPMDQISQELAAQRQQTA
jgi:hypothetical protein